MHTYDINNSEKSLSHFETKTSCSIVALHVGCCWDVFELWRICVVGKIRTGINISSFKTSRWMEICIKYSKDMVIISSVGYPNTHEIIEITGECIALHSIHPSIVGRNVPVGKYDIFPCGNSLRARLPSSAAYPIL